jgi:hypothetical protein
MPARDRPLLTGEVTPLLTGPDGAATGVIAGAGPAGTATGPAA